MTTRRELLIGAASIAAVGTTIGVAEAAAIEDTELTTGGVGGWQYAVVTRDDNRILFGIRVDGTTFCSCCETKGEILSHLIT